MPDSDWASHTTHPVMPDVIGHLLGLRGNLVLKASSVRDMVRGEVSPLGLIHFSGHFSVRGVRSGAPPHRLQPHSQNAAGRLWGPLFHRCDRCRLIPSRDGRWGGINSFMSLVPGYRPSPSGLFKERSFRKLNDGLGHVGHFLSFTPYSGKWVNRTTIP